MRLQHWFCQQRPWHCRSVEVHGCLLAGTVRQAKLYSRRVPVNPVGYEVRSSEALLSPRKKRIVDWREAQPSAVLPAGFQSSEDQVIHPPPPADLLTEDASSKRTSWSSNDGVLLPSCKLAFWGMSTCFCTDTRV